MSLSLEIKSIHWHWWNCLNIYWHLKSDERPQKDWSDNEMCMSRSVWTETHVFCVTQRWQDCCPLHLQTTSGMPLCKVKVITWTYFFRFHDKSCIERTADTLPHTIILIQSVIWLMAVIWLSDVFFTMSVKNLSLSSLWIWSPCSQISKTPFIKS